MLDIKGSRELQATVLALRQAQREIRVDINKTARSRIRPLWQSAVSGRAGTRLEQRVIAAGTRANASDRGVALYAATRGIALRGGLAPSIEWPGVEFGSRSKTSKEFTQRSRRGRTYRRTMVVGRQFKGRQPHGMVAFDAASEVGTKLVAMWVRTVVDELKAVTAVEVVS